MSASDPTTGAGQVPPGSQSPDGNGQVPPTSQASSTDGQSDDPTGLSPEQLKDALEKARKENAQRRVDAKRLAELEKWHQESEDAKLTDKERYEKQLADYQSQLADLQRARQETAVRADIKLAAAELGIKQELARRILDYAAIEYDDDGEPTNVTQLLQAAATEYGLTPTNGATPASQQPQPHVTSGGAVNPGRSATNGSNGLFDGDPQTVMARFARMSPSEYATHAQEIRNFMAANWQKLRH